MICIIDYGMGNLGSIQNMFKRIGIYSQISGDPDVIAKASKILLPGVGAFDTAMQRINKADLLGVLNQKALVEKVPVLGICLGMQLLTNSSEEGQLKGLGWIDGATHSFKGKIDQSNKVPHMGWNIVNIQQQNQMTVGFSGETRFYFVHSYYVKVENRENCMMQTTYGLPFASAIVKDNIFGAQFHPEKSHKFGMKLFENFAKI